MDRNELDRKEFIEYCWSFYGPNEIYGNFFGDSLTRGELEEAADERIRTADFAGDSFDREAVRDIMLENRKGMLAKRKASTTEGNKTP